jgi:hypothetical protein
VEESNWELRVEEQASRGPRCRRERRWGVGEDPAGPGGANMDGGAKSSKVSLRTVAWLAVPATEVCLTCRLRTCREAATRASRPGILLGRHAESVVELGRRNTEETGFSRTRFDEPFADDADTEALLGWAGSLF